MFILLNISSGKVVIDAISKVVPPRGYEIIDNVEYTDLVEAIQDHLRQRTLSIIYVPRDKGRVFDPVNIFENPLFQRSVKSASYHRPPANVQNKDRFLLLPPCYGPWQGHDNQIAEWRNGRWYFIFPREEMIVWVEDEERPYIFLNGRWQEYVSPEQLEDTNLVTTTVVTQEPIPMHRVVTVAGTLADARNPAHATQALGLSLHAVTIVGQPVTLALSGIVELSEDIQPGINLRWVWLWEEGTFKDEPPSSLEAAFSLVIGRALGPRKLLVDLEPAVIYR